MPRNRPNIGDTNWGTTLNNHLKQLSPNGGGINYGTTAQRPTLTNNDDGYTYFDTTTKQVIRWNGNSWEVIIVGLPSDDAITNLTNQINTLTSQITTLTNRVNTLETTQTNTITNQINQVTTTVNDLTSRFDRHNHSLYQWDSDDPLLYTGYLLASGTGGFYITTPREEGDAFGRIW